ncbi:MAG: enoyl-CoA hydratase/isomerase family protein [Calditrichaceae bacterium]|nr:enoyl-CoA hydratase/isomerase family protein [Calditrichaceae bacterium]MBN2708437.1 enoyl-CoA hydratase/isomerase family protein [Calditrichaceae bacterium]RQV93051.1 MAG: hypothetical protein EH224_13375 [Calditrichota bacterium]
MSKAFYFEELENKIGALYFDVPEEKVNKFNTPVMEELEVALKELSERNDLRALLLLSKKPDSFCAGADMMEIYNLRDRNLAYDISRKGQNIFNYLTICPFPTIAVINGSCMGGGTEISLACTFRLVTNNIKTSIALPEINLGLIPGWGGCTRLPRLIGLQKSFDVILTGRKMDYKKAYRSGFADRIISAEWSLENAVEFAEEILNGKMKKNIKRHKSNSFMSFFLEKNPIGRKFLFSKAKQLILRKTGGNYPAPIMALEVMRKSYGKSFKKAFELEARTLAELIVTSISKNLVQIFLWTQEIKRENGTRNQDLTGLTIKKAGILGAGAMGGGIAYLFVSKQIPVRIKDTRYKALAGAYKQAGILLKDQQNKGKISKNEFIHIMHCLSGTTDNSGFANKDVIIEAIVEDLAIKKEVLREIVSRISEKTILATNTSSLRIEDLATAVNNKNRFAGMHFFNPVHRMPLVEVVRGKHTSDHTVVTLFNLSKSLGKTPIVVKDAPGFLVNRLLVPYMVESISLLEEGFTITDIDNSMIKFGMPMGPIALLDEVGIDVADKVANILSPFMGDRMAESNILERLIEKGRLGKKCKKGFYRYSGKNKYPDPLIPTMIAATQKVNADYEEMSKRMIYPMINEAARCLEEGIVSQPRDIDVGIIFGTGFAPFKGGLLKIAETEGLNKISDTLHSFSEKYGTRFKVSGSLQNIVDSKKRFYAG